MSRNPRETIQGFTVKVSLQLVLTLIIVCGGIGASIWAMAEAFGEKATKSELQQLKHRHIDDIHELQIGVWQVRREQRIILDAVAPDKSRRLEPLPPQPRNDEWKPLHQQ